MWLVCWLACAKVPPVAAPEPAPAPQAAAPAPSSSDWTPEARLAHAQAVVAAPDRTDADRALDAGRKPAEVFAFFGVTPGMRVAEISAGGGYTTELLARLVGPEGEVWGQNSPFVLERFAEAPWTARLATPPMARVHRVDAPFDAPFPPDVKDLDLVVDVLFYHDTVWQGVDRAAMNQAIHGALRPGGLYGIVDHAARPEDGATVTETLHRIAEDSVVAEVTAAGFTLVATSDALRVPDDTRDWNPSPRAAGDRRGQSDRFVLLFRANP